MQLWIFPVLPRTVAIQSRAVGMHYPFRIFFETDVETGEELSTFYAPPHLSKRPPLLEWVALLKQVEFSAR